MVTMGRCTTGTQGIRSTRTALAKNLLASALALSPENDQHISSYSAIDTSTVSSVQLFSILNEFKGSTRCRSETSSPKRPRKTQENGLHCEYLRLPTKFPR